WDWRLTLSAARRDFIRRGMLVRTQRTGTKSTSYFASLHELTPHRMRAVLDFAVLWRSRVMAACSRPSKGLWRGGSLMGCAATPDSATTQFSFLTDQIKLSVNCPRK